MSPIDPIDPIDVARLEEGRQARSLAEIADHVERFAGGVLGRAAPGSWVNSAVGMGLDGPVEPADVARIVDAYVPHAIEPRVELCPFAHESFIRALENAGFRLRCFESILYRDIAPHAEVAAPHPAPPALVIDRVDVADAHALRRYTLTAISGFIPPGTPIPDGYIESAERAARHPRTIPIVARLPDEAGADPVAACAMEVAGEVASLFGLTVREPFRRRGIQQALLAHRLRLAADMGARVATIGSRPGMPTERNVRRMGFQLAYTKPVLVLPGPGLAPVVG